jgi:hypothetical protein
VLPCRNNPTQEFMSDLCKLRGVCRAGVLEVEVECVCVCVCVCVCETELICRHAEVL